MTSIYNSLYAIVQLFVFATLTPFLANGKLKTNQPNDIATWPNLVSCLRIPLGATIFYVTGNSWLALSILLAAAYSDLADGVMAREFFGTTFWGTIIDPLCDRMFFFQCALAYWEKYERLPLVVSLATEVFILAAPPIAVWWKKMDYKKTDWSPNLFGRMRFVAQIASLAAIILGATKTASAILWIAFGFAILAIYKKTMDTRAAFQQ